ncbi:EG45-like domain containing protein [Sesamum angolense]|uniref:EG45-like domain containing protein n=1 Tax=Sesamum angolense TaxID=2727404 RepID=A0AAE2C0F4_9LAMI|nr:EG45-like domain containing protein [Sesamum angolense]
MAYAVPGIATFSTSTLPTACYGFQTQGTLFAAVGPDLYDNGTACGRRYRIRCTGPANQNVPQPCRNGEVVVTIVDLCIACQPDQFDLSEEAFSRIADPNAARIRIEYDE